MKCIKNSFVFFLLHLLILPPTYAHAKNNVLLSIKTKQSTDKDMQLNMQFSDKIIQPPNSFLLTKSRRLVLDFVNSNQQPLEGLRCKKTMTQLLKKYCILEVPGRTRILLSLSSLGSFEGNMQGNEYQLSLHQSAKGGAEIRRIQLFSKAKQEVRMVVHLSEKTVPIEIKRNNHQLLLIFHETRLSSSVKKRYNVRDFQSPAESILASETEKNSVLTVINKEQGDFGYFVYQVDKKVIFEWYPLAQKGIKDQAVHEKTYTGKLISLNFQNVPIRAVLQILADFTGINMIVSDKVSANITLRLHNTPWDQALDIILESNALERQITGNIMRIAPQKRPRRLLKSNPLESLSLQIKYAKALDIAHFLKDKDSSLLSERGLVSVDVRTNTLWIQDSRRRLKLIENLVKQRDVPGGQVLIEARIVDVNKDFVRDLGLSWGLSGISLKKASLQGRPNTTLARGDQALIEASGAETTLADKLHMDLARPSLPAQAASLGLALATLGDDVLLDLELAAMESEGRGEIIASPRLLTMNQQTALIQSGEEVPYQEASSSGATSISFKKAVLSLQVTPRITSDGRIMMDLQINQDRLSTQKYNGVPAIMTKEIKTSVFVKNGQTIVLGGICKQEKGLSIERVPFLGKLPGLGVLFRRENRTKSNEELLIFITPKIIADG